MNMPGFTAEAALCRHGPRHRVEAGGKRDGSPTVIPQLAMSCWRVCYDISDTNSQMVDCTRICHHLSGMFL
jgi:hypothetical protein